MENELRAVPGSSDADSVPPGSGWGRELLGAKESDRGR